MTTLQVLKQQLPSPYDIAEKYYSLISSLNGLNLTEREIQLTAFTAVRGSISFANVREDFCKRFSTTPPTINNLISKLKRQSILVKEKNRIRVNPIILLDFNKDVTLQIILKHGEAA